MNNIAIYGFMVMCLLHSVCASEEKYVGGLKSMNKEINITEPDSTVTDFDDENYKGFPF